MRKVLLIGIAGGTGSGKTAVTRNISKRYGKDISILYQDSYYKCNDDLTPKEREKLNYDCPDAFDIDLFNAHLRALKGGNSVDSPKYDYTCHNRLKEKCLIPASKVIVTEGILLFCNEETRNLLDIKIFIDTEPDIRLMRRIRRDLKFRGRTIDSIASQYVETVKPMHDKYVEPSKKYADIVILNGARNEVAMNMLYAMIDAHLSK